MKKNILIVISVSAKKGSNLENSLSSIGAKCILLKFYGMQEKLNELSDAQRSNIAAIMVCSNTNSDAPEITLGKLKNMNYYKDLPVIVFGRKRELEGEIYFVKKKGTLAYIQQRKGWVNTLYSLCSKDNILV